MKKCFFVWNGIRMKNLSLNESKKQSTKIRRIKDYNNMSEERLLSVLSESELAKSNLNNSRVKEIRRDFNKLKVRFLKTETKEIGKILYEIESKLKNLFELEENLSKLKKYYDYDDVKYKRIGFVQNLFNQSTDKDYCKPIKLKSACAFNGNYIEYESNGDKIKIC